MQVHVNTGRHIEGSAQLTAEVERIVQPALARYGERITRVEVFLSDENSSQKFGDADKRCVIEARLGGLDPVTVSHQGSSVDQAVRGATDTLQKTLKRTLGRKGSIFKRRARERAQFTSAGPLLQHDVETGERDHFMKLLRPLLGALGQHARRELRIMEANRTLFPGQVIFAHLLDEVVTRAWLQFPDRPQWMALDLWLTKILDEILEETIHANERIPGPEVGQADGLSRQSLPQVDDQEWWLWLLGEDETMTANTENDEAMSGQSAWAEHLLEAEELMDRIHALLGELPNVQRRAFVLNVFEAYDVLEIAMLQDRAESDVQNDIEAARNQLEKRLTAGVEPPASAKQAIGDKV
jgi:DNA-directed RNA polymerase specialized sigma24 family protein/ribosome-associated translation inhibitor RaiA